MRLFLLCLFVACVAASLAPAGAQTPPPAPEMIERIARELSSRRFATSGETTRNLRDLFQKVAPAVPLVISKVGSGSSVLIGRRGSLAIAVTNHHVVTPAFEGKDGLPVVPVVFYHPRLARDILDMERVERCLDGRDSTPWCELLGQALRFAVIVASDPDRDLALLRIPDVPIDAQPVTLGALPAVAPGDTVAVIGHPLNLLWTLTTGIVSGVRSSYPMGPPPDATKATVIQTQTPVNPGNSGGPLLTPTGELIGVIFAATQVRSSTATGSAVPVAAQGLNLAIGVNEVNAFVGKHIRDR
jgi:S1-C subfamily serine protease